MFNNEFVPLFRSNDFEIGPIEERDSDNDQHRGSWRIKIT